MQKSFTFSMPGFFFVLLVLGLGTSRTLNADRHTEWNCQRSEDGKSWECVATQKTPASEVKEPMEPTPKREAQSVIPGESVSQDMGKVAASIRQPGWDCKADSERTGWDCNLVGPDPKGQPRIVSEGEARVVTGISRSEDDIYREMMAKIPEDPWEQCLLQLGPAIPTDLALDRGKAAMDIESNFTDVFEEEIVSFSGNVEFTRADQKVWADRAYYDRRSQTLNARGNVFFRETGVSLFSNSAFLKLESDEAHLTESQYIFEAIPARGEAQVVYQDSQTLYRLKEVTYTTCQPGNRDWALSAEHLKLDKESGRGQALNAWLNVRGFPVLYTPYVSFPLDDRRKSGFLAPSFGSTDETGFDLSTPYYWNIAPNLDATFSPRFMGRRGIMFGGEARYLTRSSNTEFQMELLPNDFERNDIRGQLSLINQTRFRRNLNFNVNANYVSDDDYLDELGNSLSFSDQRHVHSQANLWYGGSNYSMFGRLDNYQTIDPTIPSAQQPYRRLPQLGLTMSQPIGNSNAKFELGSEFVYFQRGDTVTGQRLNLHPRLRYDYENPAVFFRPGLSLAYTQYWLDDPAEVFSDSADRLLPIASVDSGVFFERDLDLFGRNLLQTLEPRFFYLYIPEDNQDDIPLFDTSALDFNIYQLFRENRFNGTDRIGDANQVSLSVTSRFIDSLTGIERLSTQIGQIFFIDDRKVTLSPNSPAETKSTSNFVAELDALIIDGLNLRSSLQWDPRVSDITRGQASLEYRDGVSKLVNVSYRYRRDFFTDLKIIDQGDISFRWPVFSDVHVVGRWQYSFLDKLTTESFLGFEKENCCWRFRLLGRYYVNDIQSDPQTGIFVQLELKGFTSFGDHVDRFLERNIAGFRIPER